MRQHLRRRKASVRLEGTSGASNIGSVGGSQTIEVKLEPGQAGWRLDRALAVSVPTLSRERLKALIRSGALTRGEAALRDPATKVRGDERFLLDVPEPAPTHNEPQDIPLEVVFEDPHLLVIDKPAGLVVHPAAGNQDGTLVNALLHHCGESLSGIGGVARPGIVHRIDKGTSGLLVVAKTDVAHEGMSKQFAAHSVDRRYLAIVTGVPNALVRRPQEERHRRKRPRQARGHALDAAGSSERCRPDRMFARNRPDSPGPGPHGVDRSSASWRSGLWARRQGPP